MIVYVGLPFLALQIMVACAVIDNMYFKSKRPRSPYTGRYMNTPGWSSTTGLAFFIVVAEALTVLQVAVSALAVCAPSFLTLAGYFEVRTCSDASIRLQYHALPDIVLAHASFLFPVTPLHVSRRRVSCDGLYPGFVCRLC